MFARAYQTRPKGDRAGGIHVNHAFALWFVVRQLVSVTRSRGLPDSCACQACPNYSPNQA